MTRVAQAYALARYFSACGINEPVGRREREIATEVAGMAEQHVGDVMEAES